MKFIVMFAVCFLSACALEYTKYDVVLFWGHLVVTISLLSISIAAISSASATANRRGVILGGASFLLIVVPLVLLFSNRYWHWIPMLDIRFHAASYEACKRDAVTFDDNQKLSVCWQDIRWEGWGFTEALIYDSSDQVASGSNHYSLGWRASARSLAGKAPFGILGFEASPLGRHFYFVTFYEDISNNF
ncbi:hypothetical protein [Burkholderia sp. 3C]